MKFRGRHYEPILNYWLWRDMTTGFAIGFTAFMCGRFGATSTYGTLSIIASAFIIGFLL